MENTAEKYLLISVDLDLETLQSFFDQSLSEACYAGTSNGTSVFFGIVPASGTTSKGQSSSHAGRKIAPGFTRKSQPFEAPGCALAVPWLCPLCPVSPSHTTLCGLSRILPQPLGKDLTKNPRFFTGERSVTVDLKQPCKNIPLYSFIFPALPCIGSKTPSKAAVHPVAP